MKTNTLQLNLNKLFSAFVALIPILQYYKSPLSSFNLATFLTVVFGFAFLLDAKVYLDKRLLPAILYIAYMSVHIIVFGGEISGFLRIMVLVVSIVILGHRHFSFDYALHIIERVLTFSTLLMVLQFIGYHFLNTPISGTIPFLLSSEGSGYAIASSRPSGLYLEPAQYAQTAIMYLSFRLFWDEKLSPKTQRNVILVIAGIVLSGSGQGYVLLGCFLCVCLFYNLTKRRIAVKTALKIILVAIIVVTGAIVLWNTSSYIQLVVSRFVGDDGAFGGIAYGGRSYTNKLFYELGNREQMFGIGIGCSSQYVKGYYINSLYYYLIENGYTSLIVLGIMILYIFFKGNLAVKIYSVALTALFVFSGVGRPMMLSYYMLFMLFYDDKLKQCETAINSKNNIKKMENTVYDQS